MGKPVAALPARGGWTAFWLPAAVIAVATALALRYVYDQRFAHHAAQLEAVSDIRLSQVETWLNDRLALAQFARGSENFSSLHRRWREAADTAAREQLLERGADLNNSGRGVLLVDELGEISAGETGPDRSTPPALRDAALRAMSGGAVEHTGLYSVPSDPGKELLDLIVPFGAAGLPARGALVLRLEPAGLRSALQVWPVPSRTAVTLLVRREGDQLVGVTGRNPRPISTPNLLAARAVRGELAFGQPALSLDVSGTPVLGVVRQVPATNWFLVAKIDRAEIVAEAWQDAPWIATSAVLALLSAVAGTVLLRERRALELARTEQARAAERAQEMGRMAFELEAAEERERRKLAHDLHDDLAQVLAAARIRLADLCRHDAEAVRSAAQAVDALVAAADASTRSLAAQLAPAVLYELGLQPALEWLGEEVERTFGLRVTLLDDGQPKPLLQATRSILYRVVRELLVNAAKHAADDVAVVKTVRDGERIVVSVSDAGVGFDPLQLAAAPHRGMGLASARERMAHIGGTLELHSAPGQGTVGVLSVPLATQASMPAPADP